MSVTGRPQQSEVDPQQAATALQDASLVRILPGDGPEAIATAGLLAKVLNGQGIPFQIAPTQSETQRHRRLQAGDPEATGVAIGPGTTATITIERSPIDTALEIIGAMESDPDPFLALAGLYAGGWHPDPDRAIFRQAQEDGLHTRPGLPGPVDDPTKSLAHSLWLHGPFSGAPETVRAHFAEIPLDGELSAEASRRLRSLVAIDATASQWPSVTADAVEQALRPAFIPGPFRTIEGYTELLLATACRHPGTAVALTLGGDVVPAATDCWYAHASAVHTQLADADPRRYDGLLVVDAEDTTTRTVATVVDRIWSPEPAVMAIGETRVDVIAAADTIPAVVEALSATADGIDWAGRAGHATYDSHPDEQHLVDTIQEVL